MLLIQELFAHIKQGLQAGLILKKAIFGLF